MARHKQPFTVGLPLEVWPDIDRRAWNDANRVGDLLAGCGPAVRWTSKTRLSVRKAYGCWLRYLMDHDRLDRVTAIGDRVSPENLRDYIGELRPHLSPNTVLTRLRHLSMAIAAMDTTADRSLLNLAIGRLTPISRPVRDKAPKLVSPVVLLDLGMNLMAGWQGRAGHDPRLNAMDYRDGLMIAFVALCPIRVANLAAMTIGRHLTFTAGRPRIQFAATEMNGKRALAFDWPDCLIGALEFYLREIHPLLYAGSLETPPPLWPSLARRQPQMTPHGIYTRITQVTEKHLGVAISPHLFRDAAATFIAELAPQHARMTAAVLQHRSFQTTSWHYIHGQQHLAARVYHLAVADIVEQRRE
ncbi:MAG: hypothetical protein ACK4TL_17375 [Hyphomicrobiaceae bacterium]